MSMTLVFTQILTIMLYIAVGFVAGKAGMISPEQRKYLSGFCSNLILPFTILSATSQTVSAQEMLGMLSAAALMFGLFAMTTLLVVIFCKMKGVSRGMRAALSGLISYPNCTFLGLPLCRALFGDLAVLYNAAAIVAFNVLFFTVQYGLFTDSGMNLKNLVTPSMISTLLMLVMLIARLHFPAPVQTVLSGVGSMITPLSLIIIGVMLSESRLLSVLQEKRSYLVVLCRNLIVPLSALPIIKILPLSPDAQLCALVYIGCPCATLTSIYAIRCDREPQFAAHTVLLSTILFAATLPIIIWAGGGAF